MYSLVSALAKQKQTGSRWAVTDIENIPMSNLFRDYSEIYVELSNPFFPSNRTLILSTLRQSQAANEMTLPEYLQSIDDSSINTVEELFDVKTNWVRYGDAFRSKYKVSAVPQNGHPDSTIPMSERQWLALTRPNIPTDYNLFFKSCLVSINGLFHRTDTDGQRVYVVDGMKSCRHSGMNTVGITNFQSLGELEFMPMTEEMITRRYEDVGLNERVYVEIPEEKIGKTPMLVLGGYLYLLDSKTFYQVNDTMYALNIRQIPWRERYFESKPLIDLSSYELEEIHHNDNQVSEEELYSDEIIKKAFTLSQSFLVFIDNVDLFLEYETLRRSKLVNKYTSYTVPNAPLLIGYGRLGDYWKVKEDGQWAITVVDSIRWNYSFNTAPEPGLVSYDNSALPDNPLELSLAQFLKIGADEIVVREVEEEPEEV